MRLRVYKYSKSIFSKTKPQTKKISLFFRVEKISLCLCHDALYMNNHFSHGYLIFEQLIESFSESVSSFENLKSLSNFLLTSSQGLRMFFLKQASILQTKI